MFSLIKFAVDGVFILFVFYMGMRVQLLYPNLFSDIKGIFTSLGSIYSFLKGLAEKI